MTYRIARNMLRISVLLLACCLLLLFVLLGPVAIVGVALAAVYFARRPRQLQAGTEMGSARFATEDDLRAAGMLVGEE